MELADPYKKLLYWVLVHAIGLSVLCSSLINTVDIFSMDESKESVTESERGSMSGSTIESKESLSESEGGSTCGSTVDNNRKRGKQTTGSKNSQIKEKDKTRKVSRCHMCKPHASVTS